MAGEREGPATGHMGDTRKRAAARQKHAFWARMVRLTHYKLVVPIKRCKHPPEHTARGVLVGMAWALTPLIGIQMYLVFMTWLIARKVFRWKFSLVVGLAWTWTTNVVTMLPTYYAFYVTGQIMLGNWDDLTGYHNFVAVYWQTFEDGLSMWQTVETYLAVMVKDWGLAMAVGSLPWAAMGGWLGYKWGLAYARRRDARRRAARQRAVGLAA